MAEPWTEAGSRVGTHYRLWFSWDCLNRPAPKPDEPVTLGMTVCIHDDDDGGACDKALYWKGNPKYPFADESAFGRLDLPPAGGRTLTYVQWNIGHFAMGKGPRTKVRPEQSAARSAEYRAFIRDLKADVIGISEFEDHFDTAKTPSRTAVFDRYPNLVAGPANSYQWNALMTREWAFKTNRVHNYKSRFQHVYWLETVCEIDGRDVHFVQTHLDWNTTPECAAHRTRQLRELADAFRDVPYVVISGDFNVYANEEYDVFREAGFSLANGGAFGLFRTMGEKPDPVNPQVLDNIVAKGFALESAEILDPDMRLSDHRVLKARLRLLP